MHTCFSCCKRKVVQLVVTLVVYSLYVFLFWGLPHDPPAGTHDLLIGDLL
jgi:hypothetical protein